MRSWCFTLNHPTEEELDCIDKLSMDDCASTKRLVACVEEGESKTQHVQGYITFSKPVRLSGVKKILKRAHWEVAKGNAATNYTYCSKDVLTSPFFREKGDFTITAGARSDIARARALLLETGSVAAVWREVDSYQAVRFAQLGQSFAGAQRTWCPDVYWFYGPTGSGKSREAFARAPDAYWATNTQWWDGYDAHSDIIIDDFRSDSYPFSFLLRLLDRYPMRVPYKGGYAPFLGRRIFITTPWRPEDTFTSCSEDVAQILRRIKEIVEFKCEEAIVVSGE